MSQVEETYEQEYSTLGSSDGVTAHRNGSVTIGQVPQIRMHAERETVHGAPIGPLKPSLDMQPLVMSSADLIDLLIRQNDSGKVTSIIGHVVVRPTPRDQKISLTEEGEAAAAALEREDC